MTSVSKYNALHGRKVTRKELQTISTQAKKEQQTYVYNKLSKLLASNPGITTFDIEITKKATFKVALAGKVGDEKLKSELLELSKKSNDLRVKRNRAKKGSSLRTKLQSQIDELDIKRGDISKKLSAPNKKKPITVKDIVKHLLSQNKSRFANDFAYVFSQDLEKIEWRIEDDKTYKEYVQKLAEKVYKDQQYLSEIGFNKKLSAPFDVSPFLAGIPHLSPRQEKAVSDPQLSKLAKPVSSEQIYDMITNRMLAMIKEATGKGYKKKWEGQVYGKGYLIPFNFDSKKRYRGVNAFLLTGFEPLENPFYLTFKQIDKLGGTLKKGAKGNPVVYFTKLYKVEDKANKKEFGGYDLKKAKDFATESGIDHDKIGYFPILKYYNVFNGKDIEGINFDLENFKTGFIDKELPPTEKMPIAEAIIEHYPKPVPPLKFGGDKAFYNPNSDFIQMPHMADFESAQDFYRTLFHEFAHSTGASNRLHRDFTGRFGSKKYAFEELIAEWGATFLSAEAGIIFHSNNNHAEYIKSWNAALTHIKDDNKFIMRACSKAQELTDYVLDRDKNGNPKYLKDFKKIVKEKSSSDQFEQFRKIVLKAKNFDDAYVMVSTVKNVPKKVADAFSKKYNPNNIRSQRQAFKVFYEEVKGKPTVSSLIKEFVESCKNDLKGGVFESTKHKFKAGDQYRSDFDYKGMLTAGTKVTEKTPASTILKLYNSFSDVNYHDQGGLLWEILELKKEANKLDKTQLALFGKTKGVSNIDLRRYKNKSKGSIYADLHKIQNVLKENIPASIKADLEADLEKLHNYAKKKFPISKKKVAIRKNPSVKKSTMDKAKKAVKKIKQLGTLVIDVSTTQPTANVKNEGLALAGQLGNVPVYEPQKTEEPKQDVVAQVTKKPKGVMSSNELMSLQFDTLNFEGEWAEFMDSPAKNMRIAIWGKPKNGKTAGATKFANYLTSFGNVLYNFADQGVNKSTKDLWQMSGLAQQPNAFLTDTRELDELEKLCASGKFDFVFIDMINTYIHRTGIKYFEFEDRFLKKFPSISFILIFEVTKNGDFKGDQGWTHLVDALITVDSFVMENTGRYGVGHYIVWKHGLETTNPKKYKEYFSEEVQYPTTMTI